MQASRPRVALEPFRFFAHRQRRGFLSRAGLRPLGRRRRFDRGAAAWAGRRATCSGTGRDGVGWGERTTLRADLCAPACAASFPPASTRYGDCRGWPPAVAVRSGRATPRRRTATTRSPSPGSALRDRARLDACADAWGITSHDLLLAILLKGLSPLTVRRLQSPTRNEIAIASDREHSSRPRGGSQRRAGALSRLVSRVASQSPDDMSLRDLAAAIHGQNELRSSSASATCRRCSPWGSRASNGASCRRRSASASSPSTIPCAPARRRLSVDALWNGGAGRAPGLDYLRAVSTGPLAPMVLAFTMVGRRDQRRHLVPHDGIPARCRRRCRCCYASIHQDALTMNRPVSLDLRALALTVAMCARAGRSGGCATPRSAPHAPGSASAATPAAAPRSAGDRPGRSSAGYWHSIRNTLPNTTSGPRSRWDPRRTSSSCTAVSTGRTCS